ncbi:MAG: dTDP-4-dehydrorhamnose 3,5-epimerase [Myxococcota bacterium]
MPFEFIPQAVPEVLLIKGTRFGDHRGFFSETYRAQDFEAQGIPPLVQHNHSRSERGVLRGLHYQLLPAPLGKLVRAARGSILDVAVDVRTGSPTYGQHVAAALDDTGNEMLWVPPGFAHGFLVTSEIADVVYMQSGYWSPDHERSLRWDDPSVGIEWPIRDVKISEKDAAAPLLPDIETNFNYES